MPQQPGKIYYSENWPRDRPFAETFHANDAKLTYDTSGASCDRHFILRNISPSGTRSYILVSFHKDIVRGKSPLLDRFIETSNAMLFEHENLENLNELHFRRMLGFFYDYDMDYIKSNHELAALYEMANLFKVKSVADFCMKKLIEDSARMAAKWAAASPPSSGSSSSTSFSDYSDNNWGVTENVSEMGVSEQTSHSLGKSAMSDEKAAAISTLKEEILGKMTALIRSEVKQEVVVAVKNDIKLAFRNDLRSNVEQRFRADGNFKYQLANEITAVFRAEIKARLVNDLRDELKVSVKKGILEDKRLLDKLIAGFDADLREDLKWELSDELRDDLKAKIWADQCSKD